MTRMANTPFKEKSTRGVFDPSATEPFRVSRSKLDLFTECPRCAYLDLRLGVKRPSMPAFTLNNAVDELLKREFDIHRARGTKHPLVARYGLDAVPLADPRMDEWRDALRRGISYLHEPTNLLVRGGIDDVWVNPAGEFIIVDYKATSKKVGPSTEDDLYDSYKRQMEIYQWLLRQVGLKVSDTGYFVYCNGDTAKETFNAKLEFELTLIPYTGKSDWVEGTVIEAHKCLNSDSIPESGKDCDYCAYIKAVSEV